MVTKEMIENSMEGTVRKLNLRYLTICFSVVFFVFLIIFLSVGSLPIILWITMFAAIFCICGSFLLYQWLQYRKLFANMEDYELYKVLLDRPTYIHTRYNGFVYFTITIETNSGMKIFRKTKALWSDSGGSQYKAWEYMNSHVWIAYDEERDKMVVLGLEDDWRRKNERDY